MTSRGSDTITWTSYNMPDRINYGSDYADFQYGAHRNRTVQIAKTGSSTTTTYYIGRHFEKQVLSIPDYRHNILVNGKTVATLTRSASGSVTTRYVHRDHENNVVALTSPSATVYQRMSFDAFGKRRNTNWSADTADTQFSTSHHSERGYTGHEHIDNARLVNMNGRVQDPIIGRMISADIFVPNPANGQSFNRFSYVRNNPLSLIDPTGFSDDCLNNPDDCVTGSPVPSSSFPWSSSGGNICADLQLNCSDDFVGPAGRNFSEEWDQQENRRDRVNDRGRISPNGLVLVNLDLFDQILNWNDSPSPDAEHTRNFGDNSRHLRSLAGAGAFVTRANALFPVQAASQVTSSQFFWGKFRVGGASLGIASIAWDGNELLNGRLSSGEFALNSAASLGILSGHPAGLGAGGAYWIFKGTAEFNVSRGEDNPELFIMQHMFVNGVMH